ncbi:MAG: hypothetical protein V7700_00290 [Halioglobus sp.]
MRLLGMVLALGAIMWVLFRASGGSEGDGIIPQEYQKSMEKAEGVEQSLQDAADLQLKKLDENNP